MKSIFFKLSLIFLIGFGLIKASAFAFQINYQAFAGARDNKIWVDVYGTEPDQYYSCDLNSWNCQNSGTSTPQIYPELQTNNFFQSKDGNFVLAESQNQSGNYLHAFYQSVNGTLELRQLVDFNEPIYNVIFSANGQRMLFRAPGKEFDVYDLKTNSVIKRFNYDGYDSFLTFSHLGDYIAYYSPATQSNPVKTYNLVDLNRNESFNWQENTNYWDLISEQIRAFGFSPDERWFMYLSDKDGYLNLYKVDLAKLKSLAGGNGRLGRKIFRQGTVVGDFIFSGPNKLYFVAHRDSPVKWSLYGYNFLTNEVSKVFDGVSYWPRMRILYNSLLFYKIGSQPSIMAFLNLSDGSIKDLPINATSTPVIAAGKIKALGNGYGVVYLPDNFSKDKNHPLLVWLHGGPFRQAAVGYHPYPSYGVYDYILEALRQNGFIVVKLDYRGSFGYSRRFAEGIKLNAGKIDVADVKAALQDLAQHYKIDKVYLMGNSYGGYLALRSLVAYTNLFDGAVSINGVTDWWTLIKQIPDSIFAQYFGGPPGRSNKKLYDMASIFIRLNRLVGKDKKIELVYGQEDNTIPPDQTNNLYFALEANGIPVKLLSYEGENHIILKKSSLFDLCINTAQFLGGKNLAACL